MAPDDDLKKYRFPQTLSEPRRFLGLPLDEAIPSLPVLLWGIWAGKALFGLIAALVVWLLIRHLKSGKGSMWLYNLLYWHFPGLVFRGFFKLLPDSCLRQWTK
jgi:conjugal transfer pilus assembly protein TraL